MKRGAHNQRMNSDATLALRAKTGCAGYACPFGNYAPMKRIFLFVLVGLMLVTNAVSSENIKWGEPIDDLVVGLLINNPTKYLYTLPEIYFYLKNLGNQPIDGVIQSGSRCVVEVNGKYYAQPDFGGKSSYMPPGKQYGPIQIDSNNLKQIPELQVWPVINPKADSPVLQKGINKVCIYYVLNDKRVSSGQVTFKKR